MLLLLSTSAKKPVVSIAECDWYRFEGKRKVAIENKTHEADIDPKDVYGIKAVKKNMFYVLHRDDPSVVFQIDAATARSLLGRSRPFNGSVSGIKVKGKASVTPAREKLPSSNAKSPTVVTYTAVPGSKSENTALSQAIRKAKIKGADRLMFLGRIPMPTGDTYNYYDATDSFSPYGPKKTEKWEKDLEEAVVNTVKTAGYLIGAALMKVDGVVRPCLIIVED